MKKILFLIAMLVIGMSGYAAKKEKNNEHIILPSFNLKYLTIYNSNLINSLKKDENIECKVEIELTVSVKVPGIKTSGSVKVTISADCKDIINGIKAASDAIRATAEEESNLSNDNLCIISIQNIYLFNL